MNNIDIQNKLNEFCYLVGCDHLLMEYIMGYALKEGKKIQQIHDSYEFHVQDLDYLICIAKLYDPSTRIKRIA